MKWISIISAVLLTLSVAACQSREPGEVEGTPDSGAISAIPEQQRQAATTAIDNRINDIQQNVNSLQARIATAPEDVRNELQEAVQEAQDEMPDIDTLKARMTEANTLDEWNDAHTNIWQEIRDLDKTVSEARFEAADSLSAFQAVGQDELQKLDQRVQELDAEATSLAGTDRQAWDQRVSDFREARTDFTQTWDRVQQATEANWRDLRDDTIDQWKDLQDAFYNIRVHSALDSGITVDSTRAGVTP